MKFWFSIVDDTDDATLENIKPVYDFLYSKGILITKTVWVYPPRDKPSSGDSLQRPEYLEFIRDLHRKGFEIALHNVGSGDYTREEILGVWKSSKRSSVSIPGCTSTTATTRTASMEV